MSFPHFKVRFYSDRCFFMINNLKLILVHGRPRGPTGAGGGGDFILFTDCSLSDLTEDS